MRDSIFKTIKGLKPVDPILLDKFLTHMREEYIPEIINSIREREKAANEIRAKNLPLY